MCNGLSVPPPPSSEAGIVDLTAPVTGGMPTYPGEPEVSVRRLSNGPYSTYELSMSSHSGTSIDTPLHLRQDGAALGDYPISRFVLPGLVVRLDAGEDEVITAGLLGERLGGSPGGLVGKCLLLRTGWSDRWGEEAYWRHPFLSGDAAQWIVRSGVSLLGVDTPNVDSTWKGVTDAHAILLAADVLIVENVTNLAALEGRQAVTVACLPLSVPESDGAPVRMVAW